MSPELTTTDSFVHTLKIMSRILATSLYLFLALSIFTQPSASAQPQASQATASQSPDRIQVDQTLQRYLSAYQHKSIQDLLAVWPDLQNQKKEYGKIKHQFGDPNISDEQMAVTPVEFQSTNDGAIVRAQRKEQYVKGESTSTSMIGDNRRDGMPGQFPGPHQGEKKKDVKKADEVWFKLRRTGDNWTIVSITEQKPQ